MHLGCKIPGAHWAMYFENMLGDLLCPLRTSICFPCELGGQGRKIPQGLYLLHQVEVIVVHSFFMQ